MTQRVALIGCPLKRRHSEIMHNAAFDHFSIDARYELRELEPRQIPEFVLGQVYDELAENALEEVALLVHAVIKVYKAGRGAGV